MNAFLKISIMVLPVFLIIPEAFALGGKDKTSQEQKTVEITGRVRIVGNMPFPEMVISDESGKDWYIPSDEKDKLSPYAQRLLTVRARIEHNDMILANGKKIGIRYMLRDIVIIKNE